jgi:hypothetical protein
LLPINLVTGLVDELRSRFPDLDESLISDMILGVVSPVGDQGGDIARTAVLAAGLPDTTGGVQLNRFCASGLEAVNTAAQKVRSGWDDLVLAGGVESMSRVPMGSDGGAWATDPETNYQIGFVPQGIGADLIATIEGFSRADVDAYALGSQEKAAKAWAGGHFARSVVPVADRNGVRATARLVGVHRDTVVRYSRVLGEHDHLLAGALEGDRLKSGGRIDPSDCLHSTVASSIGIPRCRSCIMSSKQAGPRFNCSCIAFCNGAVSTNDRNAPMPAPPLFCTMMVPTMPG